MSFIDFLLLLVFGAVTWSVASEGAWGGALILLSVLFAGLLAMNFFEPLAAFLERNVSASPNWRLRWDMIALVGLFGLFVFLLRTATDHLSPTFIPLHPTLYVGARWSCAALTGYITMAFLLTALHTAPLPREFIGFRPERDNFLNLCAPDRQWLGFTQYVSEKSFAHGGNQPRIFDAPYQVHGDMVNRYWPSFPIRYATRRERPTWSTISSGRGGSGGPVRRGSPGRSTRPSI